MSAAPERLQDLVAEKVLWGLSDAEERELARFGGESQAEFATMERVGAAIAIAIVERSPDAVPPRLEERLRRVASEFIGQATLPDASTVGGVATSKPPTDERPNGVAGAWVQWSGWMAAAAAAIVASLLWFGHEVPDAAPPPEQQLQAFLAAHSDAESFRWVVGPKGNVVWSPTAKAGFLVLDALPANDASFQYQLWIFDHGRSTDYPVDGGVFDVTQSGATVVAIDAKIPVDDAFGFAITKERPGGVVVSSREQIVAATKL